MHFYLFVLFLLYNNVIECSCHMASWQTIRVTHMMLTDFFSKERSQSLSDTCGSPTKEKTFVYKVYSVT